MSEAGMRRDQAGRAEGGGAGRVAQELGVAGRGLDIGACRGLRWCC